MEFLSLRKVVESNLTVLYGSVTYIDIDKVRTINDGYEVEGVFRLSSSIDEYTFSMTMDANGDLQTYQKKAKNRDKISY